MPASTHRLPATRERVFADSFFVRPSIFLFPLPYYHLVFACIVFRLPSYYSFPISRSFILVSSPIRGIIPLVGDAFPIVLLMCYVTGRLCFLISHIRSFIFYSSVNLYGTPPLWRGFRNTNKGGGLQPTTRNNTLALFYAREAFTQNLRYYLSFLFMEK
jgi:hypothetical protein